MVQNSEWGPHLWSILHQLASRVGRQPTAMLAADEQRIWGQFIRMTEGIMPCQMCRGHYREWLKRNGAGFAPTVEDLWSLHEAVNERRGVESGVFLSDMENMYRVRGTRELQETIETLLKILRQATYERQVDGVVIHEWRAKLAVLRRVLGI